MVEKFIFLYFVRDSTNFIDSSTQNPKLFLFNLNIKTLNQLIYKKKKLNNYLMKFVDAAAMEFPDDRCNYRLLLKV